MCGICGQFNYNNCLPVERETILRMTAAIAHRGPDDEGYYIENFIGLGFRRLSIIDISGGRQPMSDPQQRVWVIFNGEIYNFRELRDELTSFGYIFRTRSDTEVILNGYKKWGINVLEKLNGMFGLAVWDSEKRRLMLARDRAGIKPLYYFLDSEKLIFGSEIKAILPAMRNKPEPDSLALNLFLKYRYTPAPLTIFKGIRKLAPGERMIVENGEVKIERWWNYSPKQQLKNISFQDAYTNVLELYKKAVNRQLISDVPLGLVLSGGIDSGLLLALMNLYGKNWNTYTVGFGQIYKGDELTDAEETARILDARNFGVRIDQNTYEKSLSKIIRILEEPVASQSVVPMYFVSQRASQDVKVALMGQGPDELFGGYKRHMGIYYGTLWRNIPNSLRVPIAQVLSLLPRSEMIRRGINSLNEPNRLIRYQKVFSILPASHIDSLFKPDYLNSSSENRTEECWRIFESEIEGLDELGGFQYIEIRSSLPDELLMYGDKVSMFHGLEVRVPYLDHEIIEYVETLPAHYKVHLGNRKWLHRQICKQFLPKKIINRKKRGFAGDIADEWFRHSLNSRLNQNLKDSKSLMYNYFEYNKIQSLLHMHQSGREDYHKILYSLTVFEEWLRCFCTGDMELRKEIIGQNHCTEREFTT